MSQALADLDDEYRKGWFAARTNPELMRGKRMGVEAYRNRLITLLTSTSK